MWRGPGKGGEDCETGGEDGERNDRREKSGVGGEGKVTGVYALEK